MQIKINIQEDKELKDSIKEIIKSELKSLVRSEMHKIVKQTIKSESLDRLDREIKDAVKEAADYTPREFEFRKQLWEACTERLSKISDEELRKSIIVTSEDIINKKINGKICDYISTKVEKVKLNISIDDT